jgi:hypothetical protein
VIANIISNIKTLSVSIVHILLLVSFWQLANPYPVKEERWTWIHIHLDTDMWIFFQMHILMLIFYRKYVILVSCNKPQNLISWQHWYRPYWLVTRVYKHAKPWIFQGFAAATSFESHYRDKIVIQKTKHNKVFSILDQWMTRALAFPWPSWAIQVGKVFYFAN